MANKRIVKKQIRNLCGAIADELLYASCFIESFDDEKPTNSWPVPQLCR